MIANADRDQQRRVFVINPGSTSTKTAIFTGSECVCSQTLQHTSSALAQYDRVIGQLALRKGAIDAFLKANAVDRHSLSAVAGRGGLLRPLNSGAYAVTDKMCEELRAAKYGEHASNLGALLAKHYADIFKIPAFIVDPVTLDEFDGPSRTSGVPGIERKSRIHALNIKSVARRCAAGLGRDIGSTMFVIAHMGGGISVCSMAGGRIIDSTDALLGEGPFSLERAGTLPLSAMLGLCFESGLSKEEVTVLLSRKSGFSGLFGVDQLPDVYRIIDEGNQEAGVALEAMVRQIAKWIGAMTAVTAATPDAIILTGGMANSSRLTGSITRYIGHLGPVRLYPGEYEMEALAEGVIRVLNDQEKALEY
jgi:butyrate kinase